ncbi:MAG: GIN domain-containing protein [Flavobacteriaceae bacterium]
MFLPLIPLKRLFYFVSGIVASNGFQSCSTELNECFFLEDEITASRNFDVSKFDEVISNWPGNYVIKQGPKHSLEVTGSQRYIDSLSQHLSDGKLYLENNVPFCQSSEPFRVTLTLPYLKHVFVNAESNIEIKDFINQDELTLKLTENSRLKLQRYEGLRQLNVSLSQNAKLLVTQKNKPLEKLDIKVEGSGEFRGYNIPTNNTAINIDGKGYCEVNTLTKLSVIIKGEGHVFTKGSPSIYKRITGRGDVYFND